MNTRGARGGNIFRCWLPPLALVASLTNLSFAQAPQPGAEAVSAADYRPFDTTVGTPHLSAITTNPNLLVTGQAFRFTIAGTGFDPKSAIVVFTGPGCTGSTCSFTSGSLTITSTQVSGIAMLGVGSFTVTVMNGASGTPSNGLPLSVFGSSAGAPQLGAISTSPAPPVSGQAFTFTITGSGFDPSNTIVVFTGPGCNPCGYTVGSLTANATQLNGTAMLQGGTFTVMVKNGSSGALSNSLTLTVSGNTIGTPQLNTISTSPNPPVSTQAFTFTIAGTFDPTTAIVNFNGPGCTVPMPCTVANSALSSKDLAHLSGTMTLVGGTFTVTVQNGPSGTPSNGLSLTVSDPLSGSPEIRTIVTDPNPPTNAQAFTFSITGTGFDPASAVVTFDGPGCDLTSTTCIIPNSSLLAESASELDGVAILTGGTFTVTVQNVASGTISNSLTLKVSGTPGAPLLSAINTMPAQPLTGQAFTFTITGDGFDPNTAFVIFSGTGCTVSMPCIVANSALSSASYTQLSGTVTLVTETCSPTMNICSGGGNFTVTVQNGANGTPSTGLTLAVSGTTGNPLISSLTVSPDPPTAAQAFTFAITGSGFDPNNAIVVFNGPGCNAPSTTCIIANNVLLNKSSTELDGVAILAGGNFNVTVLNGPISAISNSVPLVVTSLAVPFQLSSIATSPTPAVGGQAFTFTATGSGFNPNDVVIEFNGPGCTPCTIATTALTTATSTTLTGTATLAAGTFTVLVQNGTGPQSNGVNLTVSTPTPTVQLSTITTTPNPPMGGQAFTFSITGTGLDPSSVLVTFGGPGCAPCTIANTALSSTSSTGVSGTATLSAGTYTVTVQNGLAGAPSNGLSLTVSPATGVAPQITGLSTTPDQPVDGQMFTFSLTGTGFNPTTAVVIFTGPNCTPCSITTSALTSATTTQLNGGTTLAAGNYTITVQNGSNGAPSNGQALSVAAPAGTTPQIAQITTTPSLPIAAQAFTFAISGSGFDPASAVVVFNGPNCAPCSITSSALSAATSTELDGTATLATGSYIVFVQNGNGTISNSVQLIVYPAAGTAPELDVAITAPRAPVHGQETVFIIFGSGFDPNSVEANFSGPGCTESVCAIPNEDIAVNFAITAIGGVITFPSAGTYTVSVQNGPNGGASNTLAIVVQ